MFKYQPDVQYGMAKHDIHYDEAAYLADTARARAAVGDADGVLHGVHRVLAAVDEAPYPGLLAEARAAAADAVLSARRGDHERADASLGLLAHIVADMQRFATAEAAVAFPGG